MRDPVVLTATLPRFLLTGDRGSMHLELDNVEGPAGDYSVAVSADGAARPGQSDGAEACACAAKQRTSMTCRYLARLLARSASQVKIAGPGGFALERTYALNVKPATQVLTRRTVRPLAKERELHAVERPVRRSGAGHRRGGALGRPLDRARRRDAAQGARPLSVRLLRADHQPGAAAALRQRAWRRSSIWRSTAASTSASATPSTGFWRVSPRTARSASGASAATTAGSTPTSPTS